MGGFDDHAAFIGDWVPFSPSPRAFFSSLLVDDVGAMPAHMEHTNESKCRKFVFEPQEHITSCSSDEKDGVRAVEANDQTVKLSVLSDQKMSSRGGLMERMAARSGFNAPRLNTEGIRPAVLSQNQEVRSPYLTIPAGLSPSILLDSSVLIFNPLFQPSPTTGIIPFASDDESKNSRLMTEAADKKEETACASNNSSSSSIPIIDTGRVNPSSLPQQFFQQVEVSVHPDNSLQPQSIEATQNEWICHETSDFPMLCTEKDVPASDVKPEARTFKVVGDITGHSPSLDEQQNEDTTVEDGYNWRKYEQKQVKGSEYPRSYFKCTHPNCPVKKKIERFHEGHVMKIIYDGAHNHPKPLPKWRSALGSSNSYGDLQLDNVDPSGTGVNGELALETIQQGLTARGLEWRNDDLEGNGSPTLHANGALSGSADAVDVSSTFSNDEDEDDCGTHGSASLGYDGGAEDESESKRRKIEPYATTDMSGTSKAIRKPRVVVQTTSEVDILDDGYRWRKYGQKVVKGNSNPRSYYKCTSPGCNVRKHVERASHDLKIVITTYEGKHNHDVPPARNSNRAKSEVSNSLSNPITTNAQSHAHRPEPTQLQSITARYGRAPSLSSFGPTSGFNSFGTNQQGLAGLNADQHKFPVPVHPYIGHFRPVNDAGFMLPTGESVSDPSLNYSNGSSNHE
ncbi:hypothetical protein RND71_015299 [Anisodus tanguticus]|uniref:WRKY domain-containing protein n=1 Tax=Anisodus tanguticus TaxID=243964 RepID=A0AAE1VHJ7_9SOLA|nr:hypothetical protein RND71_015299 [Anisodus tanguticus]